MTAGTTFTLSDYEQRTLAELKRITRNVKAIQRRLRQNGSGRNAAASAIGERNHVLRGSLLIADLVTQSNQGNGSRQFALTEDEFDAAYGRAIESFRDAERESVAA